MEIGVLYDDLSIVWIPFEKRYDLKPDGILAITLTTERGNRKALVSRLWRRKFSQTYGISTDYFAIGVDGSAFFVDQWDEYDEFLQYKSQLNPHENPYPIKRSRPFPGSSSVVIFSGEYVSPEKWEEAITKFDSELF